MNLTQPFLNEDGDKLRGFIHAESCASVSTDGLYSAVGLPSRDIERPQYSDACFSDDCLTDLAERHQVDAQLQFPVDKVA